MTWGVTVGPVLVPEASLGILVICILDSWVHFTQQNFCLVSQILLSCFQKLLSPHYWSFWKWFSYGCPVIVLNLKMNFKSCTSKEIS